VTSVVICDERSHARTALTRTVAAIPTVAHVDCVTDGPGLLAAFAAHPADLVLIGVHRGHPSGTPAVGRVLDRYPCATVLVYGSVEDTSALAQLCQWSRYVA
jgi:chemotaxis response regulator CheB